MRIVNFSTRGGVPGFALPPSNEDPIVRVEIPVKGCVGGEATIIILDADDSLDVVIETPTEDEDTTQREIIYSFLKEPEL